MASIAALCKRKGWMFLYITKVLSTTLKQNITGNLKAALDDGMTLLEVDYKEYREVVESLYTPLPDHRIMYQEGDLVLAQGGADLGAKEGIFTLAQEIRKWQQEHAVKKLNVITPSGTGTTAFFLAQSLPEFNIITTALIGSKAYLLEQMQALGEVPSNLTVLETEKKYHFGKSYDEYMTVYREMLDQGIEVDLLYAPKMLLALKESLSLFEGELLYIHSGGTTGNSSMLERYRYKGSR